MINLYVSRLQSCYSRSMRGYIFFQKKKRTVSLISFVDKIVCNSWVVVSTTIYIELSTIKMTARLNILGIYII